jgi:hypothetical protein
MTTNQIVDSSFTAIIKAPIDKIDIPTWLPPIVSTLMDIRLPSGGQLSLQSIMRKFELGLPNGSQRNLSLASQKTALRQERPVANRIMTMSAFYSILLRSSAGSGQRQGRWACRKLTIADHHHENCGLAEPRPFSFVFPPTRQEKERLLDPLGMKDTTFYAPSLDEHAWKLLNPKLGDMVSGDL